MTEERQGLRPRATAPGYCPSVRHVLGEEWWPGKFIYRGDTFTDKRGVERELLTALCPNCGKWVPVLDGAIRDHPYPAGSDRDRFQKALDAREAYGRIAAWGRVQDVPQPVRVEADAVA